LQDLESEASDPEEACPTCASLKEQEEAARMELARAKDLPDSEDIQRKWKHLFSARWGHKCKAHNRDARGDE
jgi:hypothetical protein